MALNWAAFGESALQGMGALYTDNYMAHRDEQTKIREEDRRYQTDMKKQTELNRMAEMKAQSERKRRYDAVIAAGGTPEEATQQSEGVDKTDAQTIQFGVDKQEALNTLALEQDKAKMQAQVENEVEQLVKANVPREEAERRVAEKYKSAYQSPGEQAKAVVENKIAGQELLAESMGFVKGTAEYTKYIRGLNGANQKENSLTPKELGQYDNDATDQANAFLKNNPDVIEDKYGGDAELAFASIQDSLYKDRVNKSKLNGKTEKRDPFKSIPKPVEEQVEAMPTPEVVAQANSIYKDAGKDKEVENVAEAKRVVALTIVQKAQTQGAIDAPDSALSGLEDQAGVPTPKPDVGFWEARGEEAPESLLKRVTAPEDFGVRIDGETPGEYNKRIRQQRKKNRAQ